MDIDGTKLRSDMLNITEMYAKSAVYGFVCDSARHNKIMRRKIWKLAVSRGRRSVLSSCPEQVRFSVT